MCYICFAPIRCSNVQTPHACLRMYSEHVGTYICTLNRICWFRWRGAVFLVDHQGRRRARSDQPGKPGSGAGTGWARAQGTPSWGLDWLPDAQDANVIGVLRSFGGWQMVKQGWSWSDPRNSYPCSRVSHQSKKWSFWFCWLPMVFPFQVPTSWVATQLNSRLVQPIFSLATILHSTGNSIPPHSHRNAQLCLFGKLEVENLSDRTWPWFLPR